MKAITAIIAIALLEGYAIYSGIDGAIFGIAVGSIAGLGGYIIKQKRPPS